jgi:hypothetical protein
VAPYVPHQQNTQLTSLLQIVKSARQRISLRKSLARTVAKVLLKTTPTRNRKRPWEEVWPVESASQRRVLRQQRDKRAPSSNTPIAIIFDRIHPHSRQTAAKPWTPKESQQPSITRRCRHKKRCSIPNGSTTSSASFIQHQVTILCACRQRNHYPWSRWSLLCHRQQLCARNNSCRH